MLNGQLKAELESEIRNLFTGSGMTEHYTPLVMGAVATVLARPFHSDIASDAALARLLTSALSLYLQHENVPIKPAVAFPTRAKIRWTGSKVGMVELIYALYAGGCFNNGGATLTDIVAVFETEFEVELHQYHKTYSDIRARKIERTKFLNGLKDQLENRMDDADSLDYR